jgi:hypothetical protein
MMKDVNSQYCSPSLVFSSTARKSLGGRHLGNRRMSPLYSPLDSWRKYKMADEEAKKDEGSESAVKQSETSLPSHVSNTKVEPETTNNGEKLKG